MPPLTLDASHHIIVDGSPGPDVHPDSKLGVKPDPNANRDVDGKEHESSTLRQQVLPLTLPLILSVTPNMILGLLEPGNISAGSSAQNAAYESGGLHQPSYMI